MKSRNGTGEEDEDEDGWEYYYDEEEEEDNPESGSVSISTPVPPVLPAVQKQPEQPSTKPVQAAATNRQDDHGKQHPLSRPNSRQTRSRPTSRSGNNHSKNELNREDLNTRLVQYSNGGNKSGLKILSFEAII